MTDQPEESESVGGAEPIDADWKATGPALATLIATNLQVTVSVGWASAALVDFIDIKKDPPLVNSPAAELTGRPVLETLLDGETIRALVLTAEENEWRVYLQHEDWMRTILYVNGETLESILVQTHAGAVIVSERLDLLRL